MDKSSPADTDLVCLDFLLQDKLGAMDTLIYVKIRVNDKEINAMLELGATKPFVVDRLVTLLGLWLSTSQTTLMAVTAKAQRIIGIVYRVPLTLEKLQEKHDLLFVTLDDFNLILGIDLLKSLRLF